MKQLLSLAILLALAVGSGCRSAPGATADVTARPEVRYYVIADT